VWVGHSCPTLLRLGLVLLLPLILGRTLLSDAFDVGVEVALAVDVGAANVT